jgi:Skp family chaperone for outer membrane proteins
MTFKVMRALGLMLALTTTPVHGAPAATPPPRVVAAEPTVPGLAFANLQWVAENSNAYKAARAQRDVVFKPLFDQATARIKQINDQIAAMTAKLQTDRTAPKADAASLQRQAQAIEQLREAGQREIQTLLQPVGRSDAYVAEQINAKLTEVARQVMSERRIAVLLGPQNVLLVNEASNLSPAILSRLNQLLPSVQLVPPAEWKPAASR